MSIAYDIDAIPVPTGTWVVDPAHSTVEFQVRHMGIATVKGQFTEFAGSAHVDTANPANSKVEVSIVANSINTGQQQRDDHLRSGDFFESEQYPDITFTSTDVTRDGDEWTITGDLTIKGVSRSISVPFEFAGSAQDPFGNTRIGVEGAAPLNRKDWGLTWNAALETGGVLVSEKIKLEFDVSAIKNA